MVDKISSYLGIKHIIKTEDTQSLRAAEKSSPRWSWKSWAKIRQQQADINLTSAMIEVVKAEPGRNQSTKISVDSRQNISRKTCLCCNHPIYDHLYVVLKHSSGCLRVRGCHPLKLRS